MGSKVSRWMNFFLLPMAIGLGVASKAALGEDLPPGPDAVGASATTPEDVKTTWQVKFHPNGWYYLQDVTDAKHFTMPLGGDPSKGWGDCRQSSPTQTDVVYNLTPYEMGIRMTHLRLTPAAKPAAKVSARTDGPTPPTVTSGPGASQVAASPAAQSPSGVWRARLGITYQYYASVGGAVITAIEAGGPAAQAGLKVGDTITAIQGFAVTGNDSFPAVMRSLAANQAVTLVYIDGSTRQQRQATSSLLWPQ